ncbi:MAG TPA: hypothetical protein VFP65_07775 [Anaeromyxobacteraceae bacterium]|nr:hypothetical protein [Anaeromyxobacteraceae bacterium]
MFDDHQEVPPGAEVHDVLKDCLSSLPQGLNAFVLSRSRPPARLARLLASEALAEVEWDAIRFDVADTKALVALKMRRAVPDRVALRLHEVTRGWPAGIVLLVQGLVRDGADVSILHRIRPDRLFDYFAEEAFARADARTRDVLLRTALLPGTTAPLAREITGVADADRILRDLCDNNFFTVADGDGVYRYHPLFREFLLARASEAFSVDEIASLRRRVAARLEEAGRIEDAVRLYVEARAWHGLAGIVKAHAGALLRQGRNRTVEGWVRAVPAAVLDDAPWLRYWLGAAVLPLRLEESREHLEAAFRLFRLRGDAAGSYLAWCGVVDTFMYGWGRYAPLRSWIAEAEELRRACPIFPSPEIEARFTCAMFCALAYHQPDHPDMPLWEERARAIALGSGDPVLRTTLGIHLVWYESLCAGDRARAEVVVNGLRDPGRSTHATPFLRIAWCSAEAASCLPAADAGRLAALVEEGLALARETGIHVLDFSLSLHGCWGALVAGDLERAAPHLRRMSPIVQTGRSGDIGAYHATLAWAALVGADAKLALQHARTALALAREADMPFGIAVARALLAQTLVECGAWEEARASLDDALRTALRIGAGRGRAAVALVVARWAEALYHLRRGEAGALAAALREYLAITRQIGLRGHVGWSRSAAAELCAEALAAGIQTDHVRAIVSTWRLAAPSADRRGSAWPWPVRVHALGPFELWRDGTRVAFASRTPRKPLELLQLLAAPGPESLGEEAVASALWPEADGDAARHALETTLSRLRRILGEATLVVRDAGALRLDEARVWSDARALQLEMGAAEAALRDGGDVAALRRAARDVVALYRGRPFPTIEAPWAEAARRILRARVARVLDRAASRLDAAGERATGEEMCLAAAAADPELPLSRHPGR